MDESTRTDLINLKHQDFEKVCRCCLSQESLLNLFELNYEDVLICDIISQLFSIQVNFEDERPKNICETCIAQVIQFYQFKKNIETTEEIFSTILEETHIHQSIKEEEKSMDGIPEEVSLEDTKFQDLIESKIPKTEDENFQAEAPNSVPQSDENGAKKRRRRDRSKAGNPKFVNKRYKVDSGPVQCPFCSEIFDTATEYYTHRKLKIDTVHRRKHPCSICGKLYSSNHMAQHLRSHQQGAYQCEMCEAKFKSLISFRRHKKGHLGAEATEMCEVCGKAFIDAHALRAHKLTHNRGSFLCSMCGKDFRYKHTYIYHMKKHRDGKVKIPKTEPEIYFCQTCNKEFKSKLSYENHVLAHSGKRFPCEVCGKSFSYKATLRHHIKAQHVEKKERMTFNCTHCSYVFNNRANYESHIKSLRDQNIKPIDYPETQHYCHICSKYFATKSSLNNHMGIHSEIKVLCSVCGKKFNSKSALKLHSIIHTGEKRFACTYCDKKFTSHGGLRTHTFGHTGERPYVCNVCSKGFTQGPKLKIHMRTHTGERPYVCPHCNKTFRTQTYLVVHIRSHTGETPYVCEVCSRGFNHSSGLTKHKQTHFKELQTQDELNLEFQECEEPALD